MRHRITTIFVFIEKVFVGWCSPVSGVVSAFTTTGLLDLLGLCSGGAVVHANLDFYPLEFYTYATVCR